MRVSGEALVVAENEDFACPSVTPPCLILRGCQPLGEQNFRRKGGDYLTCTTVVNFRSRLHRMSEVLCTAGKVSFSEVICTDPMGGILWFLTGTSLSDAGRDGIRHG